MRGRSNSALPRIIIRLAHLVDHGHVDVVERQRGHAALRVCEQRGLGGPGDVRRVQQLDAGGPVVGVLDDREAAEHLAGVDDPARHPRDPDGQVGRAEPVDALGAALLAQPDGDDLGDAALDVALEVGVRLDPVDREDAVGLGRVGVEVHGRAAGQPVDLDGLHRGADRHAEALLGHPEVGEQLDLPLRGGAAVRAHRRHHERLRTGRAQPLPGRAHHLGLVVDAPAAGGDRHGHAGPDPGPQRFEGLCGGRGDVGHVLRVEPLPHRQQPRERHVVGQVPDGFERPEVCTHDVPPCARPPTRG
jgi:hypothetical protein